MVQTDEETDRYHDAVWGEFENLLANLAERAKQDCSADEFYQQLLNQLATALAAEGGACWLRSPDLSMRLSQSVGSWSQAVADQAAHEKLLQAVCQQAPLVLAPGEQLAANATNQSDFHLLVGSVSLADWIDNGPMVAIVELLLPQGRPPSSYAGAKQVVEAACGVAAEYHVRQRLGHAAVEKRELENLNEFSRQISGQVDLQATCRQVANEARRILACDRVSVLVLEGGSPRLMSVSGTERVERRGRAARGLEALAKHAIELNEPIWYADGLIESLPQIEETVTSYVDEFHARQIVVLPVAHLSEELNDAGERNREQVAALVAEDFAGGNTIDRRLLTELAEAAAPSIATAKTFAELPFATMLHSLRWLRMPRTRKRLAAGLVALGLAIAALLLVPAELRVDARGQLLPTQRQDIFAPRAARVDKVLVGHGERVLAGQSLLQLQDSELATQLEQLRGKRDTLARQIEAVRAARAAAGRATEADRYQLSSEEERLKTEHANVGEQIELLEQQQVELAVSSPMEGMITTWQVSERLATRPVERGQVLLSVANTAGDWELELAVPDEQMDYLRKAIASGETIAVEFRLGSDAAELHRATVTHISRRAEGAQAADSNETRHVLVRAMPDSPLPDELKAQALRPGGSVRARILCGKSRLGYVWLSGLGNAIRNWWEF